MSKVILRVETISWWMNGNKWRKTAFYIKDFRSNIVSLFTK